MAVTLTRRHDSPLPLDFEGITPTRLREAGRDAMERILVLHGNRREPLGEHFAVSVKGECELLVLEGDCSALHGIGAGLSTGEIRVEGNAGRRAGATMRGGILDIRGHAGDWLGGEMRGGRIIVRGSAGDQVGSAFRGSRRGMNRGEIFIHGDAGMELGRQMRRGLIVVAGRAGEFAAYRMLAGTIILGGCGGHPGAGMRRGTLWFPHGGASPLPPTFRQGVAARLVVLDLLRRKLAAEGFAPPAPDRLFHSFHGDFLEGGRGEVFLPLD